MYVSVSRVCFNVLKMFLLALFIVASCVSMSDVWYECVLRMVFYLYYHQAKIKDNCAHQDVCDYLVKSMLGFYEAVRSTLSQEKMIRSKVADRAHS